MPKEKEMLKKVACSICGWESQEQTCPVCGWLLFSEDLLMLSKAEVEARTARFHQAQKQWQEAFSLFQKGEMGTDESAIPSLLHQLEPLGFHPGPDFEKYISQLLPGPFGGTAFLGVEVQGLPPGQEAEITINGQPIGTTKEGYLAVRGLRAGRYRLEASTPTQFSAQEVEIREGTVLRVELRLQPGKSCLRVLSFIGGVTVKIGGQSFPAPFEIEVGAGNYELVLERKGEAISCQVEVKRGEIAEIEIASWPIQGCLWVREGHTGNVHSVAFSPDGRRVASGGGITR